MVYAALPLLLLSCGSDNPPAGGTVTATESWRLRESGAGQGRGAEITLSKLSTGSVSVSGTLSARFLGVETGSVPIYGSADVHDSSVTIITSGTFTDSSAGNALRSFLFQANGIFSNRASAGTWEYQQSSDTGTVQADGEFTGTLQSGNGVTPGSW
jgi:hypothetical protein